MFIGLQMKKSHLPYEYRILSYFAEHGKKIVLSVN